MRRILLIYNPHSSNYIRVQKEVIPLISKEKGYLIGKFAIKKAPFEENVMALKEVLMDGDIVISAGGDATAAVTANAILESGKDVALSVLPYGNFNDLARTLKGLPPIVKLYALDILVDGVHWRYATCYATIGMTAEATEIFDRPKIRKALKKGHRSSWRSYSHLASWYFKNRHSKIFLPEFALNGQPVVKKASDYIAVNGRSMSRVMKGGKDFLDPHAFRSKVVKLTSFPRLAKFMATSIFARVPGTTTTGDTIEFKNPATVEIQAEGEYCVFKDIKTICIKKLSRPIKVICKTNWAK